MRYLIHIMIVSLLVMSCQIEDENAPKPDEAFIKFYGELTSYEASDIEVIYDATGEVAEGLIDLPVCPDRLFPPDDRPSIG